MDTLFQDARKAKVVAAVPPTDALVKDYLRFTRQGERSVSVQYHTGDFL